MRPRLLLTSATLSVVLGATGFANGQTSGDTPRDPALQRQERSQHKVPNQTTGSDTSPTTAQSPSSPSTAPANSNQSQVTPAQTPADARSQNQPASGQSNTQSGQAGTNQPSTAQSNQPASAQTNQPAAAQTTSPNTTQPSTASGNQTNQPATAAQQPAASPANQAAAPQNSGQAPTRLSASLQTEQRTRLNQALATLDVRPVNNVNFAISVGTAVPQTVSLRPVPATIVSVIPQYRGYNFFVVRDEIVIVEPSSHRIVDVIQRGGAARAQATTTERKLNLSSQQREIIRKHSQRTTTTTTTGSAPRSSRTVTVGEEAPDTVVIESFPEEVYREVPEIRSYRYIQGDRGVYIVDPQSRRVIEEFD